jgi:hypothetical protein
MMSASSTNRTFSPDRALDVKKLDMWSRRGMIDA